MVFKLHAFALLMCHVYKSLIQFVQIIRKQQNVDIPIPIHFEFVINLECQYKLRVVAFMILIYYHLNKKYYCNAHVLFLLLTIS